MTTYIQAKEGRLDYTIDWSDWLDGDLIGVSTWSAPNLTVVNSSIDSPATSTTVWLTGGEIGSVVEVRNTITTNTSPTRITSRTVLLEIYQR